MTNDGSALPGTLPSGVRARMITLASQGLSRVPTEQVPPPLRKAATFAPARRAKLVGNQIAEAVERDDDFRMHLATQVRALVPEVVAGLEPGTAEDTTATDPDAEDDRPGHHRRLDVSALSGSALTEAAAVAYILRPAGWQDVVAAAQVADEHRREASGGKLEATVDKLNADLSAARGEVKAVREKLKSQLDDVKSDNTQLRRTLGQTRAQLRDAQSMVASASETIEQAKRDAEVSAREADAEARRLKARIAELEQDSATSRRAARDDRDAETTRLRLLLESVIDGAAGLRRELALGPAETLPADTVPSVEPGASDHAAGVGRALLQDDPALLRRLLELPRAHLIIDGYNVSKTAWPSVPLDQQRSRLVSGVAALVAGKGIETTVVFDGAELLHPPSVTAPRGVRVRFSPPGVIADDLIRQLVSAEPVGRSIVVVSTDREVAESVGAMGARSVASVALVRAMGL